MVRLAASLLAVCGTTLTLAFGTAGSEALALRSGDPVTIDQFGVWTLARLGYGDQVFDVQPTAGTQHIDVQYRLPPGARQGPTNWYLLRLHFTVTIAADSGDGRVYVDSGTNGWASAQIRFDVTHAEDGTLLVRSSELGLVNGSTVRSGRERTREITFRNYIPYGGVRPGVNPWRFSLEQADGARAEALRIFSDSAIEYTHLSPVKLSLIATQSAGLVRVGQDFRVWAKVRNSGGRTAPRGVAYVRFPSDKLRLLGRATRPLPTLASGKGTTAQFRFRALKPGSTLIKVGATSGLSHDDSIVGVLIRPRR